MKRAAPILVFSLLAVVACRRGPEHEAARAYEIEKHYQDGPAALTLRVSRKQITVADHAELVLEARAGEGQKVQFPAFDNKEKLGKFTITGSRSAEPRLVEGDRVLTAQTCELEPFLPGEYEIPAMTVHFGAERVIKTEPIRIQVASVLPKSSQLPDIKEIAPPVSLPGLSPWFYGAALLALAAAGIWFWQRHRKRKQKAALVAPAHERALRELRKLMEENLIAKGQAKLFYLRVSAILRHYIEERFSLRAPERTTEEFLHDLHSDRTLNPHQKDLLKEFLEHCDMVKFAEYQPVSEEIDNTVNTCAQFIVETRPPEPKRGKPVTAPAATMEED